MLGMIQYFGTLAMRANLGDDLSTAATFITRDLGLGEHAREYLLSDDLDTSTVTGGA